jgi:hypothetical protein
MISLDSGWGVLSKSAPSASQRYQGGGTYIDSSFLGIIDSRVRGWVFVLHLPTCLENFIVVQIQERKLRETGDKSEVGKSNWRKNEG